MIFEKGILHICSTHAKPKAGETLVSSINLRESRYNITVCRLLGDKPFLLPGNLTVRLLKPGPPRQRKPIRWQNWNNRFQHFQIQPIKCPVQQWNLNLFVVMLKQLRFLLINCQAQAISTSALENTVLLYFRFYIYYDYQLSKAGRKFGHQVLT